MTLQLIELTHSDGINHGVSKLYIYFRYAKMIHVGDEVLIHKDSDLVSSKVIETTNKTMQGKFTNHFIHLEFWCNCHVNIW